jgi:hypothetical protein
MPDEEDYKSLLRAEEETKSGSKLLNAYLGSPTYIGVWRSRD